MTHDETYQTNKFGDLLMLVTGGTNHTMAEEHLLYRKALRAVVELITKENTIPLDDYHFGYMAACKAVYEAIEKELK